MRSLLVVAVAACSPRVALAVRRGRSGGEPTRVRRPAHGEAGSSASALRAHARAARAVAGAALDLGAMEVQERVARAEPQRAVRPGSRLVAVPRARERPGERVVAEDRRTRSAGGTRPRDEGRGTDPVVGVEDGGLDVRSHAVGCEDPVDGADRLDLPLRRASVARARLEVGEERDELRQRDRVGRPPREANRPRQVAAREPRGARAAPARRRSRAAARAASRSSPSARATRPARRSSFASSTLAQAAGSRCPEAASAASCIAARAPGRSPISSRA